MAAFSRLYFPLLGANLLQQFYNILNSIVVSRYLGEHAFSVLGISESVMNLFLYVISGACLGASVLVARFYGEGNFPRLRQQLYVSGVLIGGCTLLAVTLGQLFLLPLLRLIQTPQNMLADTALYLRIILCGMLFSFAYNFLAGTLRAIGDTRAALWFLALSLGYNLACAWLLVAWADLGIAGTALATASAQLLSAGLCLLYLRRKYPFLRLQAADCRLDRQLICLTGSYAAVSALQQSSLYLGKLMIQAAVNSLSDAAIAAFTAATRVENCILAIGASGSEAIAIFVAQNRGAQQPKRALDGFYRGLSAMLILSFLLALSARLAAAPLLLPFLTSSSSQALTLGCSYLQTISWFYILSFAGYSFAGHYRGEGRMTVTFVATTLQVALRVVGTYLLAEALGLNAVAIATGVGWVLVVLLHGGIFLLERRGIPPAKPGA